MHAGSQVVPRTSWRVVRRAGAVALAAVLLGGCGGPGTIDGEELAEVADEQLRKNDARIVEGTMECPSVEAEVDKSVRCTRTAEVEGRRVVLAGTVTVKKVEDGNARVRVQMDDEAKEFGRTGQSIADDIGRQFEQRFGRAPEKVECPYLEGKVGTEVTCDLESEGEAYDVVVTATAVDEAQMDTDYTFRAEKRTDG